MSTILEMIATFFLFLDKHIHDIFALLMIVFAIYWQFLLIGLYSAKNYRMDLTQLEMLRILLRPIPWVTLFFFIIWETAFSFVYAVGYDASEVAFYMQPIYVLFTWMRFWQEDPGFIIWLLVTIGWVVLFAGPYTLADMRGQVIFKHSMLDRHAKRYGDAHIKLLEMTPGKLLPLPLARGVAMGSGFQVNRWIKKSFDSLCEFKLKSANNDYILWEQGSLVCGFWESGLAFVKYAPYLDGHQNIKHEVKEGIRYFDGLIIQFPSALAESWDALVFKVKNDNPIGKTSFRQMVDGKFTKEEWTVSDNELTVSTEESPELYPDEIHEVKMDGRHAIHYIGVDGTDVYLFLNTDLATDMFDFHYAIPIKQNDEVFQRDLDFVNDHLQMRDEIVQNVTKWLGETGAPAELVNDG